MIYLHAFADWVVWRRLTGGRLRPDESVWVKRWLWRKLQRLA